MGPYKFKFGRIFRYMIKKTLPHDNVLDVACADAKFRVFFGKARYTGMDISKERLTSDSAQKNLKKQKNSILIHGDITNPNGLPVDDKFDLVVSTHTIKHIKKDIDKKIAINNLIKKVKSGGYIIIQLSNNCLQLVKPILDKELILQKHKRYRGFISKILEKKLSGKFHMTIFGRYLNLIFSYIDFGNKTDNLLLYRKNKMFIDK